MINIFKKYITKQYYHYSLVLGIALVAYPIYDLYSSIKEAITNNELHTNFIDVFFISTEVSIFKLVIYSFIIILVGIKLMNYAKKGFDEKVYNNDSSESLNQNLE